MTTPIEFTKEEIEEWIALHRMKVIWLTVAGRDVSYHKRRIRELTERVSVATKPQEQATTQT